MGVTTVRSSGGMSPHEIIPKINHLKANKYIKLAIEFF